MRDIISFSSCCILGRCGMSPQSTNHEILLVEKFRTIMICHWQNRRNQSRSPHMIVLSLWKPSQKNGWIAWGQCPPHWVSSKENVPKCSKWYTTPYHSNQLVQILESIPHKFWTHTVRMLIPSHPQTMNRSPTLVPCALFHPFTSFDCTSHWSASAAAGSSFYMAFQGAQVIHQMARLKATCVPLARFQLPIVTMGVKTMEYHTNLQQAARDDPLIPDCQNYVMCIPESVSCLKASLQSNCSGSLDSN